MKFGLCFTHIFLVLLFALAVRPTEESDQLEDAQERDITRCKRDLVESYGLSGHSAPRGMAMHICPAATVSCCSFYDQFTMYTTWKKIKPKMVRYYDSIYQTYKALDKMTEAFESVNMEEVIARSHIKENDQVAALGKFERLKSKGVKNTLKSIMMTHVSNSNYLLRLRSTFLCAICDFASHPFVSIRRKKIQLSESTCFDLAQHTVDHAYILNMELMVYLDMLAKLLAIFPSGDTAEGGKPIVSKNFKYHKNIVENCGKAVNNSMKMDACIPYCNKFRLNNNSPIMEGYQRYFIELLNAMTSFFKDYAPDKLPAVIYENRRLVSTTSKQVEKNSNGKITKKHTPSRHAQQNAAAQAHDQQQGGAPSSSQQQTAVPESDSPDEEKIDTEGDFPIYKTDDMKSPKDFYDEGEVDPNVDEYVLGSMFNEQDEYNDARQEGYVAFVNNKLEYFDAEMDYENGDDELFHTVVVNIVDLSTYTTEVGRGGLDLAKHLESIHIDDDIGDLMAHIKQKSKKQILYEKLDPALLEIVNDLENYEVKEFHQDNYLNFKDFHRDMTARMVIAAHNRMK